MKIYRARNLVEWFAIQSYGAKGFNRHDEYLRSLMPKQACDFTVEGFSYPAGKLVNFICDFKFGSGYPHINWRERVVCPVSGFNNRMRAAIHSYDLFSNTHESSDVYIMEQTTLLYKYLKAEHPNIIGSEYLGPAVPLGSVNNNGIRNEDATRLSFESNSLDAILSFDVFEHIYDYKNAFAECARVLRKDGCMIFTVPFCLTASENIERAFMNSEGLIEHLMEPEYHGDPISGEGILCFRHYGWNMLKDLREAGFIDAYAAIFNSIPFGYYTNQVILYAQK